LKSECVVGYLGKGDYCFNSSVSGGIIWGRGINWGRWISRVNTVS